MVNTCICNIRMSRGREVASSECFDLQVRMSTYFFINTYLYIFVNGRPLDLML